MRKNDYRRLLLQAFQKIYVKLPAMMVVLFLLNLLIIASNFITPYLYSRFINDVIIAKQLGAFFYIALGYVVVLFANIAVRHIMLLCNNKMSNQLQYELKKKYLSDLLSPEGFHFPNTNVGEMKISMEDDINSFTEFLNKQIVNFYSSILVLVLSTLLLFTISWQLALILLLSTPCIMLLDRTLSKKEKVLTEKNRVLERDITNWLNGCFTNWSEVKALSLEKYIKKKFVRLTHRFILNSAQKLYYFAARYLIIPTIRDKLVLQVLIYSVGGILVINGRISVGVLLIFSQYYALLTNAIKTISLANSDLLANEPIIDRVLQNLSATVSRSSTAPKETNASLCLNQVNFTYPNGLQAIKNVSLTIRKGQRVVIYGESGSGKSTLLKLMTGALVPTKGDITFSGLPLEKLDRSYLYKRVGIILQNAALFNSSIWDNLILAKENATMEEIERVAREALIWEDIQQMPQGLDTVIGENGSRLSGGQRQRLILARQLLMDNEVLILDEATSNLDERSERLFYQALLGSLGERTLILVNHNMKVLPGCDVYVHIVNGEVLVQ